MWLAVLVVLTACAVPTVTDDRDSSLGSATVTSPTPSAPRGTAARQLAGLEVKGRAPMTGYDRDRFGAAWLDTDRNGCDTRNDMLTRDLERRRYDPKTRGCVVVAGVLDDPFTGHLVEFTKGDGHLVDVDHVVSLGNAWATGAFRWEIRKRAAFANDPMNLLAVDASANRQKGDGDAATWLPSNKGFRCEYVARQIGVKSKYALWVTPAEGEAMARVLDACPGQPRADDSGAPVLAPLNLSESDAFESCAEARAAGAAPLRRGDPGYNLGLDGDRDGIACE
jgi:hypothetical protein